MKVNGTRLDTPQIKGGGANIEMGGGNSDQLIEYVHSFDPRSWSCLHIAEGPFTCNNATIQHNDIGPCGSDVFQEWADGISVSCQNSLVRNNTVNNPTVRTHAFIVKFEVTDCSYRFVFYLTGWRHRAVRRARNIG